MNLVSANDVSFLSRWKTLFDVCDHQHPLFQVANTAYYKSLFAERNYADYSVVILKDNVPVMGTIACVFESEQSVEISAFGLPLTVFSNIEASQDDISQASKVLIKYLKATIEDNEVSYVFMRDVLINGQLSPIGSWLLSSGAQAASYFTQIIDITKSETTLYREVRKSYKSLINWGKKNLDIRVFDKSNITPDIIEEFRQLHIKVAGRETRSSQSWEKQLEMISNNEAFAVLGWLEAKLVTAALFPFSPTICFYGISAANRDMFDKPLSHAILWRAITHAKQLECQYFEIGTQYYTYQKEISDKERSISTFKHGFGGCTKVQLDIQWEVSTSNVD